MEKSFSKIKKEYEKSAQMLSHKTQKIEQDGESYLAQIKVLDDEIIFYVYSCDRIFHRSFNYQQFTDFKKELGFESRWDVFFGTIKEAFEESGFIKLDKKKEKNKIVMTIAHPIGKDVKVSSHIVLDAVSSGTSHSKEMGKLFFNGMLEMMKEMDEIKAKALNPKESKNSTTVSNFSTQDFESKSRKENTELDISKKEKRKYQSNLINPNTKKRKIKGAMFTEAKEEE